MTKEEYFYWNDDNMKRSLNDIRKCCLKLQFSWEHPPLLKIPLEHIVLDELQLMLRITGKYSCVSIYKYLTNYQGVLLSIRENKRMV